MTLDRGEGGAIGSANSMRVTGCAQDRLEGRGACEEAELEPHAFMSAGVGRDVRLALEGR